MLAISTTNEDDLLAIWSQTQYRSCTANRTVQYLARSQSSVLGEGGHKNLGGGTLTQPRPDEFGMRQRSSEYFALNPMLSFFGMDFALKFGGRD